MGFRFGLVVDGDMVWSDYDDDGDQDVLITGRSMGDPITRIYRNDREWLSKHRPKRKPPHKMRPYLDWPQRDEELAGRIATAAAQRPFW